MSTASAHDSRPSAESRICRLVVGTAGHIDHGKSTLVEKLTGTHPDRLKEEKERGLTTDIGYAHFRLADGSVVGIVDVPGHERFVKNMVAGATGIDFVLLVVAADDGVMPQTREHLEIMSLLGLERGAVVLTKIDLVEEGFVDLVREELRETLAGSFLEGAPVFPVSSATGAGLDALRAHLERELPRLARPEPTGAFRMPVQRVFSAKGFGTVVTGVPVSGRVSAGDTVEVLSSGREPRLVRVRGIQAYGEKSDSAGASQRAALNLSDVDYKDLSRGDTVATPGSFLSTRFVEARFRNVGGIRKPIEHMMAIRFHAGTAEALGRIAILDRKSIAAGEEALVQFRLDEDVVVAPGDRYVARLASPNVTLGGGVVLGESDLKLRRLKSEVIESLKRKDAAQGDPRATVDAALRAAGELGASLKELPRAVGQTEAEVRARVKEIVASGRAVHLARESRAVHCDALDAVGGRILALLAGRHAKEKLRPSFPKSDLLAHSWVDADVFNAAVARLVSKRQVAEDADGKLRDVRHAVTLSARQEDLAARIEKIYLDAPFATPRAEELPAAVGAPAKEVDPLLRLLLETGTLKRLGAEGILLHRDAIASARDRAVAYIKEKGELVSADFKDVLGSTRKYVIPLLEHLDDLGVTKRDGSRRLLGPRAG